MIGLAAGMEVILVFIIVVEAGISTRLVAKKTVPLETGCTASAEQLPGISSNAREENETQNAGKDFIGKIINCWYPFQIFTGLRSETGIDI